jgi:hypothetical protein
LLEESVGSVLLLVGVVTGAFLTERYSGAAVLLLFGLIQKEAKRSRTSNRPARQASAPPWMFGPAHVGMLSVVGTSVGSWILVGLNF